MGVFTRMTSLGLLGSLLVVMVTAAPVAQKNQLDSLKSALKTQLKDREALEKLASLAGKSVGSGTAVTKTKSSSFTNVNGVINGEQTTEEKVVDPLSQKLLSDVAENVEQKQAGPEDKPHSSVVTSVDIPEQGVHKVLKQEDGATLDLSLPNGVQSGMEFTPEAVARYLYRTGEQQEFKNVLNDLVNAAEISPEEAEQYEKTVMDELYKLDQSEQESDDDMTPLDSLYPQGFASGPQPVFPVYNGMQDETEDAFPIYGYQNQVEDNEPYVNYLMNQPMTLDEMISTLLEEWLDKAILSGDPEAEEILTNIVDYVSRDNDPNDEGQVKQILSDIFAEALLEDLSPRVEPQQQIDDISMFPQQPNNDDVKPIVDASEATPTATSEEQSVDTSEELSKTTDDLEDQLKM